MTMVLLLLTDHLYFVNLPWTFNFLNWTLNKYLLSPGLNVGIIIIIHNFAPRSDVKRSVNYAGKRTPGTIVSCMRTSPIFDTEGLKRSQTSKQEVGVFSGEYLICNFI